MIIKDQRKRSFSFNPLWLVIFSLIAFTIWAIFQLLKKPLEKPDELVMICDAENVDGEKFVYGDDVYTGGNTQSDLKSRSGKYSSYVNPKNKYSMGVEINDFQRGDEFRVSVWRWSKGVESYLAASGNHGTNFLVQENEEILSDQSGWSKIEIRFVVPDHKDLKSIKIFPYYAGQTGEAFFDDLKIERLGNVHYIDKQNVTQLYLDTKAKSKIKRKRDEAVKLGILQTADDDWVKAKLIDNKKELDVKVRLKGDWTDHLEGSKWSFRIKTQADNAWNRMQIFSFQSPHTRLYLKEWLYHEFLRKEDVLSPRYDFISLKVNDKLPALYAYEEHFDKILVEHQNRREGVIVKYDESAVWEHRIRVKRESSSSQFFLKNDRMIADILPFREGKTLNDSTLFRHHKEAFQLLEHYRLQTATSSDIFDIETTAKYYAISDLMNAYHGVAWHNQRFYYNPVIRKLEPIGFDGFMTTEYDMNKRTCMGCAMTYEGKRAYGDYFKNLFRDSLFIRKYIERLEFYSRPDEVNKLLETFDSEIAVREKMIQKEKADYQFNRKSITKKGRQIQSMIRPFDKTSLRAYRGNENDDIQLTNYHILPLEVIGSGNIENPEKVSSNAQRKMVWSNHALLKPEFCNIKIPREHQYIYFQLPGLDAIYSSKIKNWSVPSSEVSMKFAKKLSIPLDNSAYEIRNNEIRFKPGIYSCTERIVIPNGYRVVFEPGAQIDLKNKSYFFSQSSVQAYGTEKFPVKITSTDQTGRGFHVVQSKGESQLSHMYFDGLNTINEGNWIYTGAVSFYESDVKLTHCEFSNNLCEDGLNLIRSQFEIDHIKIRNTFADGFDADFCTGVVRNSHSFQTGNDAFDFSGSRVEIIDCVFNDIGDKAVSVGEQSTVWIEGSVVDKADIGVASKDLSVAIVKSIELKNCDKGFSAYQKKPEYGPATITVQSFKEINTKYLEVKDAKSKINFPEK